MNSKEPVYTKIRIVAKVGIIRSLPRFACKPTKKDAEGPASVLPIGLSHTFELVLFLYMQNDQLQQSLAPKWKIQTLMA